MLKMVIWFIYNFESSEHCKIISVYPGPMAWINNSTVTKFQASLVLEVRMIMQYQFIQQKSNWILTSLNLVSGSLLSCSLIPIFSSLSLLPTSDLYCSLPPIYLLTAPYLSSSFSLSSLLPTTPYLPSAICHLPFSYLPPTCTSLLPTSIIPPPCSLHPSTLLPVPYFHHPSSLLPNSYSLTPVQPILDYPEYGD